MPFFIDELNYVFYVGRKKRTPTIASNLYATDDMTRM